MIDFSKQYMESEEVYLSKHTSILFDKNSLDGLIDLAKKTKRNRVRFCAHQSPSDDVHEMFIVHSKNAHVPVHKHINRSESLLVLEGRADFFEFSDDGDIIMQETLGPLLSGDSFYRKISPNVFHTLIIRSEWFVFLEITKGPFDRFSNVFADWCFNQDAW